MRFRFYAGRCLPMLLVLAVSSATFGQDAKTVGSSEYFPLAEGTQWEYVTKSGKIVTQVVKHEEIEGLMCARIEATLANNKKSSEYVRITKDGIYRIQASDRTITPPLRFLMLPVKVGATWQVESKTLGLTIKGTFKVSKGTVKVPAGEFQDVIICTSDDFMIADKKVPHTYWFAKGVGIVKQVVKFGNQEMVLELEKFTPGNNVPGKN
ncbi:MAG: hypothetical protein Tsb009_20840 [Planctomycetaceae bacterium]